MLQAVQGTPLATWLYYIFHVLGFLAVFGFNIWHGRKRNISPWQATITTIVVYGITYIWIYILYWAETGFTHFGGMNIVRGFVYIPLIAWPMAKLYKIEWKRMCDFIAPCACISQGISHIGCIFECCCAGYPSDWGIYNQYYGGLAFPSQLFEAATALLIVGFLVYWDRKRGYVTDGKSYPVMLILFGSTRFLWEFTRNNEKIWLGCSSLAFHALFMAVVGAIALCFLQRQQRRSKISRRKRK